MERTLISWNLPNWLTVLVMAAGGYAALALIVQTLRKAGYTGGQ
jgi:hypothetical protein